MTTHPDNIPDEVGVEPTGIGGHDEFVDTILKASCAVQHAGTSFRVYVPRAYSEDDIKVLYNDIIHAGYVVTRSYPIGDGIFAQRLEVIPIEASAYSKQLEAGN